MASQALLALFFPWAVVALPRSVPLARSTILSPPTSRVFQVLGNGSSIPAGGAVWPTAIYWTTIQIGTPAQDFPVAIDSGSGDLNVEGAGCKGCVTKPPNRAYDPKSSSSSKPLFPFVFSDSYQTCDLKEPTAVCTISGRVFQDKVSMAGLGPVDVKLGSITKQTSNFNQFQEIDGVMGFTAGGKSNVFAQLVAAGKCDNVWALCMYEGRHSNGTLTIGGVDPRLSDPVAYVPDSGIAFHSVHVASMKLGEKEFNVGQSAILDTGTNVLLLPSSVYSEFQSSMCADTSLSHCQELWQNKCFDLTDNEVAAYPPLTMQLDGTTLEMDSKDYLLRGSPLAGSAGQYCLGIRNGGSAGGSGFIIGDTTMRHYYLVFDLAQRRIGWGKVNKQTCGSITSNDWQNEAVVV
mmetsp:Transcript_68236/g.108276  ORF Transcript_68236/g.108276 Transcript_68236/m.108276 type:complete len:405 (+) Transcript_68236:35-1249(+)